MSEQIRPATSVVPIYSLKTKAQKNNDASCHSNISISKNIPSENSEFKLRSSDLERLRKVWAGHPGRTLGTTEFQGISGGKPTKIQS